MNKFKTSTLPKAIFSVIAVGSTIIVLLAIIGVAYPNTRELPSNCKKFSLIGSVSTDCMQQISTMTKAETVSEPICYDNDRYVPCSELANGLLKSKQLLAISGITSLASISALVMLLLKRRTRK